MPIDLTNSSPIDYINVIPFYDGNRYYQLNAKGSADGKTWQKVLDFLKNNYSTTLLNTTAFDRTGSNETMKKS